MRERGRQVWTFPGDIAQPARARTSAGACSRRPGPIDILVNNVGGRNLDVAIEDTDLETWQRFVDLNLTHCFICTKIIGGAMLARGAGRIINIASISGLIANRGIGGRHYETTKAALIHFTRATAADWAPRGVTVNAICPGLFMTEPNVAWAKKHPEVIETFVRAVPDGPHRRAARDRAAGGLSGVARFQLCHRRSLRDRRRLYAVVMPGERELKPPASHWTAIRTRPFLWQECRGRYWYSLTVAARACADCAPSLRAAPRSRCCRLPCQ